MEADEAERIFDEFAEAYRDWWGPIIAPAALQVLDDVEVPDDAAAQSQRFLGSPTLRVDGRDVEPGAELRTDFGLKCRLYRTEDGFAGVPQDDWVLDALRQQTGT